jgi:hypothetical protein
MGWAPGSGGTIDCSLVDAPGVLDVLGSKDELAEGGKFGIRAGGESGVLEDSQQIACFLDCG